VGEIKDVEKIKHTNTGLQVLDDVFHESDEYSECSESDEYDDFDEGGEDYKGWYDDDRGW